MMSAVCSVLEQRGSAVTFRRVAAYIPSVDRFGVWLPRLDALWVWPWRRRSNNDMAWYSVTFAAPYPTLRAMQREWERFDEVMSRDNRLDWRDELAADLAAREAKREEWIAEGDDDE